MKSALLGALSIGLALSVSVPLFAQLQDNTEKRMTCDNGGYDSDRARHCEIREQSVPAVGHLDVDAGHNGGVTIKGWTREDVLVRSRVDTSADTQANAALLATQVSIVSSGGQVRASGTESADHSDWSVTYEIFVPQMTDLTLKSHNGGLTLWDVRGQIRFEGNNGGVHLKRVSGDVSGSTINGGIQVELAGNVYDGRQMELSTHNGGVTVTMPSYYSAHIQAETGTGNIRSDFPNLDRNTRPRRVDMNLGSGGALIHVTTNNGGITFKHADTQ